MQDQMAIMQAQLVASQNPGGAIDPNGNLANMERTDSVTARPELRDEDEVADEVDIPTDTPTRPKAVARS